MKAKVLSLSILLTALAVLFYSIPLNATNENSCVSCHTDEALLKKLTKVPVLHGEEGEG